MDNNTNNMTGIIKRYDPTVKYIRDYIKRFRDRYGIPEDRLHIITEGPSEGIRLDGHWIPKRSRLIIDLIHGIFMTVIYLGDWDAWRPKHKDWILTRWYGGTIMLPDESGPYELQDRPMKVFLRDVRRLLEIDQERPLTMADIQEIIKRDQRPGL